MNKLLWLSVCAGFGLGVSTARAGVWYVATNGSDAAAGTSWETAFATISNALATNAVVAGGHEIWVSNGTYALSAQLSLTKGVRLWGAYGAGQTVLDGGQATRCVYITEGIMDGFTVTNGYADATASYGGGIYAVTGQVLNCTVAGNRSHRSGGGIYGASGGAGIVSNCVIAGNIATNSFTSGYGGGGAYFGGSGWQVLDCPSINDNQAYYQGGGLKISGASLVSNCVVSNNSIAYWGTFSLFKGGGVYLESGAIVTHCTISSNFGGTNGGSGGGAYIQTSGVISNCTVRKNEANTGGGIYASGGLVVNCTDISENRSVGTSGPRGGGVYGVGGAVVSNCVIRSNTSPGGGGVCCSRSTCTVADCVLEENAADEGGGILCHTSKMKIMNCLITRNVATTRGGGIGTWNQSSPHIEGNWIENCTIVSNYGGTSGGGGMYLHLTNAIINTIIYSNDAPDASDDLVYGIYCGFTNCCTPVAASLQGERNIADYPQFAAPESANWRLTADSPCVNAGTNVAWDGGAKDLDGHARVDPFSRQVDIGAFEYLPQGALIRLR